MKKIVGISIVVLLVLVLSYAVWKAIQEKRTRKIAPSIEAIQKDRGIPVTTGLPGSTNLAMLAVLDTVLEPNERARIMSEIAGRIQRIHFEEGASVSNGSVVVELHDEAYQAAAEAAEADFADAETNLNRVATLLARGGVSQSAYDSAAVRFERARAALVKAEDELDDCVIKAPLTGRVAKRYVDPGVVAAAGTLLMEIVDVSRLKAEMHIPESQISLIETGMVAEISIDALGGESITARIARINPEVSERGRRLKAVAYIDSENTSAVPGMFGAASIRFGTRKDALVVPSGIIVVRGGDDGVFVVEEDKAVFRKIEQGIRSDGLVEVISGLAENDLIVVDGNKQVADGARVLVKEE